MHTNDLVVNDGSTGEAVEGVAELLPHLDGKAATAFIVKAINAVNAGTLVVSTQEKKVLGILDFVSKEKTDDFERLLSTIDIITQKEIVGLFVCV